MRYNSWMSPVTNEPDDMLEQVLEDERTAAMQEAAEHVDMAIDTVD